MKKRRKVFNTYNLIVIICLLVIGASLYVILNKEDNLAEGLKAQINNIVTFAKDTISNITGEDKEDKQASTNVNTNAEVKDNTGTNQNVEGITDRTYTDVESEDNTQSSVTNSDVQGISEEKAREIAMNEFIKLGEEYTTIDTLTIRGILRGGERYFEVSSLYNIVEINLITGKVERINNQQV